MDSYQTIKIKRKLIKQLMLMNGLVLKLRLRKFRLLKIIANGKKVVKYHQ